jgi:signal transduction histidine kinase
MTLLNSLKKRNTLRWFFLGIGIVAVLALTTMNVYSLYALRESTIEVTKDNKKNQLEEFSSQIRSRFFGPFRDIRNLDIEQLEKSWALSGNFPEQFTGVLSSALDDSVFSEIYYLPGNDSSCHTPDQPIYHFDREAGLFMVAGNVPKIVCDGFSISSTQVQVTLGEAEYRWNNRVTFDAHRSMTLALINLDNRTVAGHLNFIIDRDFLVYNYIGRELKKQFSPTEQTGIVVWLRDWMQGEILTGSDDNYVWNRDVYEIDLRQRFPDMLDNWTLHASFLESPTIAASNASLARNLIVLGFAVFALFVALVFMFINAQRERELAQRQAGFLANITHELKTPLAVMQAAGENIADGRVTDGNRLRNYGDHIYNEAVRLKKMIEKLLDVAKVDAGQNVVEQAPHQIEEIAEKVYHSTSEYIRSKGFTYEFSKIENLPLVMIDADHLETILNNLLENAVKYSHDEKHIRLSVTKSGSNVAISVTDKGDGIPRKAQRHIFDKFYRVENANSPKTKGHGLGLAIVKNLVEMNGGKISVESFPGEGSTFMVQFPIFISKSDLDKSDIPKKSSKPVKPVDANEYV